MEEAKTMMKVGEYHENIVNLQGITAKLEGQLISQVKFFIAFNFVLPKFTAYKLDCKLLLFYI